MGIIRSLLNGLKKVYNYVYNVNRDLAVFSYRWIYYTLIGGTIMLSVVYSTHWVLVKLGLILDIFIRFNINEPFAWVSYEQLAWKCLLIGIFEETIFRYMIMDRILKRWLRFSWIGAAIISSFLFGIAHFNNVIPGFSPWYWVPQVIGAGCVGAYFAYIYRKVGLYMAIVVHELYDFFIFIRPDIMWIQLFMFVGWVMILSLGIRKLYRYLMKRYNVVIYIDKESVNFYIPNKPKMPYCRLFEKIIKE